LRHARKRTLDDRRFAAALRYRQEDDPAPRLVAKGTGVIAEKIIAAAKDAGVPVYEDPDLLALLMTLNVNELIPPDLYIAVAEVLAFIYRMNERVHNR
jgi:flagellar biosynthesis protein